MPRKKIARGIGWGAAVDSADKADVKWPSEVGEGK